MCGAIEAAHQQDLSQAAVATHQKRMVRCAGHIGDVTPLDCPQGSTYELKG